MDSDTDAADMARFREIATQIVEQSKFKINVDLPTLTWEKTNDEQLDGLLKGDEAAYAAATALAEKVVKKTAERLSLAEWVLFIESLRLCNRGVKNYTSTNWKSRENIRKLQDNIATYLDSKAERPLNVLIIAPAGSGKSHLVKCLSKEMPNLGVVEFNMATMDTPEDFARALDEARSVRIRDKIPFLFLDEFDSHKQKFYPMLLPVLWDGTFRAGGRDLTLGKIIIVLAASGSRLVTEVDRMREMRLDGADIDSQQGPEKEKDLLSRINGGVLELKGLIDETDKIIIAASLLRERIHRLRSKLEWIPRGLLVFLARVNYRFDVRSLRTIVEHLQFGGADETRLQIEGVRSTLSSDPQELKDSAAAGHLQHADGCHGVVSLWNECMQYQEPLPITSEFYPGKIVEVGGGKGVDRASYSIDESLLAWINDLRAKASKIFSQHAE